MSRERCPSCPVDDSGMPCAAPRCPWSVDGVGLIAPVPFPRIGEPGHDEWMARGAPVEVHKYERVCVDGRWFWKETA